MLLRKHLYNMFYFCYLCEINTNTSVYFIPYNTITYYSTVYILYFTAIQTKYSIYTPLYQVLNKFYMSLVRPQYGSSDS